MPILPGTDTAFCLGMMYHQAVSYTHLSIYNDLPAVVEEYMEKVNAKLGTNYQLFNYYGAPDADRVIISMGSI